MPIKQLLTLILSTFILANQAIASNTETAAIENNTSTAVIVSEHQAVASDDSTAAIENNTSIAVILPEHQTAKKAAKKIDVSQQLINDFMQALLIENMQESAQAIMPYVHKSLLSKNQKSLDPYVLEYSFKKAHENAQFYQYPVEVINSEKNAVTTIGHRKYGTAERGHEVKYFLAKKTTAGGLKASLVVFFPKDGAKPSISYMGSL